MQFVLSETSDIAGDVNKIAKIVPMNNNGQVKGAREFVITFENKIDKRLICKAVVLNSIAAVLTAVRPKSRRICG